MRVVQEYFRGGYNITPSDTDTIRETRALYIGGFGDLKVDMADGSTVTFTGIDAGLYGFAVKRIYSTGSTATNIVALY